MASSPTPDRTPSPVPMPIRRSTRSRRSAPRFEDEEFTAPKSSTTGTSPMPGPSNRPKRKAAQEAVSRIAPETPSAHRELLENALAAMKPDEHRDFAGWVELESDPAVFNEVLISLGAPGLQVSEVFGVDPASLALLPTPVYGLVFLYEYDGEEEEEEAADKRQDCPDELWFSNQTTANACATVAMFNILMNVPDPSFGTQLAEFKAATTPLSPPHRGHKLDENDFIRAIHNSVARRLDLWSEDLLLDNKFETYAKQQKRKTGRALSNRKSAAANTKASRRRRAKKDAETANHYIAYVPVAGKVWELDGLRTKPVCLGPFAGDWLPVAATALSARMASGASFNLLAVVPSVYERAAMKRGNYIPAGHAFLAKLAEKGMLEQAIASST